MKHGQRPDRLARQLELPLPSPVRRPVRRIRRSEPATATPRRTAATRAPRATASAPTPRAENRRPAGLAASAAAYRHLDERTRRIGLEGIAAARALLEPSRPVEEGSNPTCAGPGRAA